MISIGVTGSSGFIGKHLVNKLCKSYHIRYFDSDKGQGLGRREDIVKLVTESDGIVHLAAVARVKIAREFPYNCMETNVVGTLNILECIRQSSHKPFLVYASSIDSKKRDSVYGISKYMCELLCYIYSKQYKLDIRIVRIPDVYGRGMNQDKVIPTLLRAIRHKKKIILHKPKQVFNLVHYSKVVDVIASQVITLEKLAKEIKDGVTLDK